MSIISISYNTVKWLIRYRNQHMCNSKTQIKTHLQYWEISNESHLQLEIVHHAFLIWSSSYFYINSTLIWFLAEELICNAFFFLPQNMLRLFLANSVWDLSSFRYNLQLNEKGNPRWHNIKRKSKDYKSGVPSITCVSPQEYHKQYCTVCKICCKLISHVAKLLKLFCQTSGIPPIYRAFNTTP